MEGLVLAAKEIPRQKTWGNAIDPNSGTFDCGDLAQLLGDLLKMSRKHSMSDAMQHVSRLHRRLVDLSPSTMISNITSVLIPYMKFSAQVMSDHGVPLSDPAFQQLFTKLIHQAAYRYVGHEPQPGSLTRDPRGCRRCADCNQLDAVLESSSETGASIYVHYKKQVDHLDSKFTRRHFTWWHNNRRDNITTTTQKRTVGYSFEITKTDHTYEGEFEGWERRFNEMQGLLRSIAPETTLRQLLGQRFEELVLLHGTILVRTPEGTILTPPTYLHQRPPTPAPLVNNGNASSSATQVGPSTAGTLKRKGPTQGRENGEPSRDRGPGKKRAIVRAH
ncbi:hypothetical protein PRZ48_010676 [Zasmidium cellare]|uniref:Transposase n=1 Tax=Zasmidium cellare TaxID=395010 RepID=A0ABR0E9B2_ZASCE|nr:hypothetical protein PRZ48_010676 [Zasmidium cellare]